MTLIRLDASDWRSPADFWDNGSRAVGAPVWYGRNLDALWDGLHGDVHPVAPPLHLQVSGMDRLPPDLVAFLARVEALFSKAAASGLVVRFERT